MADDREREAKRRRLSAIAAALQVACDDADALHAHLLAAKIEDSRLCVEEMLRTLAE